MQFAGWIFRHKNVLALLFRKVFSSKSDKVAELAEDTCTEALDKEFIDIFALSVQDLAEGKVVAESNVEKVECNVIKEINWGVVPLGNSQEVRMMQ